MDKRFFLAFAGVLLVLGLDAQTNVQIKFINMQELIYYVIPFYIVTLLGFGLFIQKLMRPSFSNKWLYICTLLGILGAAMISFKVRDIKDEQFIKTEERVNLDGANIDKKQIEAQAKQQAFNEDLASYWNVAIPNFILLFLGLAIDVRDRKKKKEGKM